MRTNFPLLPLALAMMVAPTATPALSQEIRDISELEQYFGARGTTGTIVIHNLEQDVYWIANEERSSVSFSPSSTFKIPNTLIALESGAASGIDEVFAYGGEPFLVNGRPFLPNVCEADISLAVALQNSCIPVYQEVARRVGNEAYTSYLAEFGYGSGTVTSDNLTDFWLTGDLHISAREQVEFLDRMIAGRLPVSAATVDTVADALIVDAADREVLHAKSGYVFTSTPALGWYVGWLDTPTGTYTFALNLDMTDSSHSAARKEIAVESLQSVRALEAER